MKENVKSLMGVHNLDCYGEPTPDNKSSCCVADAVAKEEGKKGCGCLTSISESSQNIKSCC